MQDNISAIRRGSTACPACRAEASLRPPPSVSGQRMSNHTCSSCGAFVWVVYGSSGAVLYSVAEPVADDDKVTGGQIESTASL